MKRTLIALAVAASVALPVVAQAAPKVYGQLNLSVEQFKLDYDTATTATSGVSFLDQEYSRMTSNASRFGAKGEDELTATLSAIYQIEWAVTADGDGTDLTARNRYVGIKSTDFGALKLGQYDSYTKLAQGKADLFNDYIGDMEYVIAGENRLKNVVGYESPKFMDALTFNVMTQTQDTAQTSTTTAAAVKSGSSASVVYHNEDMGLYVALAADMGVDSKTALFGTRESDNMRLVASYKVSDLTLNYIYQASDAAFTAATHSNGTDGAETAMLFGAAYTLGDQVIKLQYGMAERDTDGTTVTANASASTNAVVTANKRTQMSVGVDHNFSSKTKAFIWYTSNEEEGLKDGNSTGTTTIAKADNSTEVLAIGMEHKF